MVGEHDCARVFEQAWELSAVFSAALPGEEEVRRTDDKSDGGFESIKGLVNHGPKLQEVAFQ